MMPCVYLKKDPHSNRKNRFAEMKKQGREEECNDCEERPVCESVSRKKKKSPFSINKMGAKH